MSLWMVRQRTPPSAVQGWLRLLIAVAVAAGCGKKPPPAMPPLAVEVTPVAQRDVPIYGETIGTLDGFVNAEIRPQVGGYILRQVYREGSVVRKEQLLFEIDPRQFRAALDQARGNLARNEAALVNASQTAARFRPLAAQNAISQQELDNALADERQAKANVDAARATVEEAQLNLDWTKVASPIEGIAGTALSQVGDLVSPQTVLTTVSQVDPIKVVFSISERTYMRFAEVINRGEPGPKLEIILSTGQVYPHKGDVLFTDRQVDIKTGTITLRGSFANPGNFLRPGQYAKVRAVIETRRGALLVPQRAVVELQGTYMVVVVGPDNKAEVRPVERGDAVDGFWIIEKGLKPGERVVVEGIQKVRPGVTVDPKPASPEGTSASAGTPRPAEGPK